MSGTEAEESHAKNYIQSPTIWKALFLFPEEQNKRLLRCFSDFERKKQLQSGTKFYIQNRNKNNIQERFRYL